MILQRSRSSFIRFIQGQAITKSQKFSTEPPILTEEVGNNAMIILNRPKSLNALATPLLQELFRALTNFENNKSVVLLKGAGDRAFSAGGDLLELSQASKRKDLQYLKEAIVVFHNNIYLIYKYKIPTVALMNGVTVGGGAGVASLAKYRIATEKTIFSMPEVKIGFHPNGGGTYFFNRSPGKLGYYLGLTGNHLAGIDVVSGGYATHFCVSKNMKTLEEELLNHSNRTNVKDIIETVCEKNIPEFSLAPVMDQINACFGEHTVEEVILKLTQDASPWARNTLDILKRYSPTSLKTTLRQLQRGKDLDLATCLLMETNLSTNFYNHPDFHEGVRVTLEDRGDCPKWNPSKLSEVTEKLIENQFQPILDETQLKMFQEIDNSR